MPGIVLLAKGSNNSSVSPLSFSALSLKEVLVITVVREVIQLDMRAVSWL